MQTHPDEILRSIGMNEGLGYLVVNRYGAICLVANNVFFGDIDEGVKEDNDESRALIQNIETVAIDNNLCFRIYKTFVGLRLMETNGMHAPDSRETREIMRKLKCDPAYVMLTKKYNNFRVRLTPKPWRCDQQFDFLHNPEAVNDYLQNSNVKVAEYLGTVGTQRRPADSRITQIVHLHDGYCHIDKPFPLA